MEARDVIVALLLFGLFATILLSTATSLYNNLDVTIDTQTNSSMARLYSAANKSQSDLFSLSRDIQEAAPGGTNSTSTSGDTSFLGKVLQTGYSIIMLIPNTIGIMTNLIGVFGDELHIPPVFITTALAIFVVSVILLIAGALMGSRILR